METIALCVSQSGKSKNRMLFSKEMARAKFRGNKAQFIYLNFLPSCSGYQ
jgi:hypothetical protein